MYIKIIPSLFRSWQLPYNDSLFTEGLTQHPAYPSLRSLSDTFDELNYVL
jgi:hypothetical protein